jgi:hypothetical protein
MKLELSGDVILGNKPTITLSHKEESFPFNVDTYDRGAFNTPFDMFEHINAYWASRQPSMQNAIFSVFKDIRRTFDNAQTREELTIDLTGQVKKLMDLHRIDDLHNWIMFKANVNFPANLNTEYIESYDRPGSREQTYLLSDYTRLVALTLCLRLMIPIWGEYIARTHDETGPRMKEYYAFQLLGDSEILDSHPVKKLMTYITKAVSSNQQNGAAIISGISMEDYPTWLLSITVVKKLPIADIRGADTSNSLVSYVFKFISSKVRGTESNLVGNIKQKGPDGRGDESGDKTSRLEGYKIKQELPAGDIVMMEHTILGESYAIANTGSARNKEATATIRNIQGLALKLEPDIDLKLVVDALETTAQLMNRPLFEAQIILVQLVIKPIIPPRGVEYLSKEAVVKCIALTQAVLWHRGHYALAGLVSATTNPTMNEVTVTGSDSRSRIPKEMLDQIAALYPYNRNSTSKAKATTNPGITTIEILSSKLAEVAWHLTLKEELLPVICGNNISRLYPLPHDIRVKIATLVLSLTRKPNVVL